MQFGRALRFIQNDLTALTRCKFYGHIISSEELARIKRENEDENESECIHCGWPVVVRRDEDHSDRWLITED